MGHDEQERETTVREFKKLEVELSGAAAATSLEWYKAVHGLRSEIEVFTVLRHLRPEATSRVLDVGCGAGRITLAVAPHVRSVTAIDIASVNVEVLAHEARARGLHNVSAHAIDANELEPGSQPFDRAVAVESIQHIPDSALRLDAVRRIRACMAPGGRFVIVMYRWGGIVSADKEGTHADGRYRFAFTADEMRCLLRDGGFRDVRVGGCVNVPYRVQRLAAFAPGLVVRADAWFSKWPVSARTGAYLVASGIA